MLANHGITDGASSMPFHPKTLAAGWMLIRWSMANWSVMRRTTASSWQGGKSAHGCRMVSTKDGHEIFSCTDSRYSSAVIPAIDPIDIGINSLLSLIQLRDIELARTEYEVGREIVLSLPRAQRNISELRTEAKEETRGLDSSGTAPFRKTPCHRILSPTYR